MEGPRNDVNILLVPMDHTLFCLSIDSLKLHKYPHFWHNVRRDDRVPDSDREGEGGSSQRQVGAKESGAFGRAKTCSAKGPLVRSRL